MIYYYAFHSFIFFFKQKTAYEMRISDWSSDVCSSDLDDIAQRHVAHDRSGGAHRHHRRRGGVAIAAAACGAAGNAPRQPGGRRRDHAARAGEEHASDAPRSHHPRRDSWRRGAGRSEEHTSELQSLMRISYAVFCLKKKK